MVTSTRERVQEMRREGLRYRQIASELGISYNYAKTCGSDRAYESAARCSRESKRRRVGTCERCGEPTRYNGHSDAVSRFCAKHNRGPEISRLRAGTRGRTADFLAYLSEPRRYSEFRDHFGISSSYASVFLNRAAKRGWAGRLERGLWVATP